MDYFDEDTTVSTNDRSFHRFDPKLDSMPEQKRAADPAVDEVEKSLEELKLQHSNSRSGDTKLCAMPRRRSSASGSQGYRSEHAASMPSKNNGSSSEEADATQHDDVMSHTVTTEFTEETDCCSMVSLQGTVDETDPFQIGLYGDDDDDVDSQNFDQPSMPKQKAHFFDSCISLQGSTDMFDSFQVGLMDEDDAHYSPRQNNDSDITKKSSNTTSYLQAMRDHDNSMAAMRSSTGSGMFDPFQAGLLDEEEVELPEYSTPRISNKKAMGSPNEKASRRSSSTLPTINQSLDLDDVFGSRTA
ncbi:MAG: hypothetical protein SGBAC_011209 [Bacillariaceae sp.]